MRDDDNWPRSWLRKAGDHPACAGRLKISGASGKSIRTTPACAGTTTGRMPRPARRWDHPRSWRGRREGRAAQHVKPRTTPERAGDDIVSIYDELTIQGPPPCAGPRRRLCSPTTPVDQPRVRGDDMALRSAGVRGRVWGQPPAPAGTTRPPVPNVLPGEGTTPACAGTTLADLTDLRMGDWRERGPPLPASRGRLGVDDGQVPEHRRITQSATPTRQSRLNSKPAS